MTLRNGAPAYERFLSFRRLVPEKAHAFANVDHRQRIALVAEVADGQEPELIGVARYGLAAVTETPRLESRLTDPAVRKAMEARVPLGRLGRPDDIAQAVLHLASDEAAWTTGTILTVDGGIMAQ